MYDNYNYEDVLFIVSSSPSFKGRSCICSKLLRAWHTGPQWAFIEWIANSLCVKRRLFLASFTVNPLGRIIIMCLSDEIQRMQVHFLGPHNQNWARMRTKQLLRQCHHPSCSSPAREANKVPWGRRRPGRVGASGRKKRLLVSSSATREAEWAGAGLWRRGGIYKWTLRRRHF